MAQNWLPSLSESDKQDEMRIPERVKTAISEQQNTSERLIGWIQLVVVLIFGVLYALSPKTFPDHVTFEPVPVVLSVYFLFTVFRLWFSYKRALPGFVISISIVADVMLLFGTIFTFHIQYDQPPSFYLKAPTLLYIFIFIALRTLRFEARYIVLSGVVAALGWGVMVTYVVISDDMNSMLTRDYVHYLTSNSVLIGAEFDKVVSIVMVALILALATIRARTLLVRAVSQTQAAQSLSKFFSKDLADKITHSEQETIGDVVSRTATIMNVDIRGFTPLTQRLNPREQIALITEYQARIVPVITKHGGHVDKFLGDGIMSYFGVLTESETHAKDCLKAMEDIIKVSDEWNRERNNKGLEAVVIHCSCASGPIVFGIIGEEHRLEYTVIGDAANLSAKMEKHTKTEGVRSVASAQTVQCAQTQGYENIDEFWEIRKDRTVLGVDHKMDIAVLIEKEASSF